MVITSPQAPVKVTSRFRADFSVIDAKNIITNGQLLCVCASLPELILGYQAVLHAHTVAEEVSMVVSLLVMTPLLSNLTSIVSA